MKWREQHEAFKRLLIQQGIHQIDQLNQALPLGCSVPKPRLHRWLNYALQVPKDFSSQRRYVNRFKLGADPEFVFIRNGDRISASQLNLQQGLAFGMDNNGRLVELRPAPSRSAVNVVASLLTAMRWLSLLFPATLEYLWVAGAFQAGDCLGGHVHFGRKRPNRSNEVKALDIIDEEMIALKLYPINEVLRRRQGDGRNPPYGLPGDIRLQTHGYEYRSFASWLDSPELAFLSIVLSKLAVHNPSLTQGFIPLDVARHGQRIRNILSYYKDVDDDARLALALISRRYPAHTGGDFKARWGLGLCDKQVEKITFVPSCFEPTSAAVQEVFDVLWKGNLLKPAVPEINWGPLNPPDAYQMLFATTTTHGAKGLGELIWDVCTHKSFNYSFVNCKERYYFSIPNGFADTLPTGWRQMCQGKVNVHYNNDRAIYTSEQGRKPEHYQEARRILLETVFPFWKIGEVKPDSFGQWRSSLKRTPAKKFVGKLLVGDVEALPFKELR